MKLLEERGEGVWRGVPLGADEPVDTVSIISPPVSSIPCDLYVYRTERALELRPTMGAGKIKLICRNQVNGPWRK